MSRADQQALMDNDSPSPGADLESAPPQDAAGPQAASPKEHRNEAALRSTLGLLAVAITVLGLALWYGRALIRPYLEKLAALVASAEPESKAVDNDLGLSAADLRGINALGESLRAYSANRILIQPVPSWQFNDFGEIMASDALLSRVADSTPPDGRVWSFTSAQPSITHAYRQLLVEVTDLAQRRGSKASTSRVTNEDWTSLRALLLGGPTMPYRQLDSRHRRKSEEQTAAEWIARTLEEVVELPEAGEAFSSYWGRPPGAPFGVDPAEENRLLAEAGAAKLTRLVANESGNLVEGLGSRGFPVIVRIYEGPLKLVALRRANWFNVELVRQARRASLALPTLQRFFGPNGRLGRIPVAFVVRLDGGSVFDVRAADELNICEDPSKNVELITSLRRVVLPCAERTAGSRSSLWRFEDTSAKLTLVAVVSEVE